MTTGGGPLPRLALDSEEAAAACGISPDLFLRMVREGVFPQPVLLGRRNVWPVRALALALDRAAGLGAEQDGGPAADPILESIRAKRPAPAREKS